MFNNFPSPLPVFLYSAYSFAYQQNRQYSEQMHLFHLLTQRHYNMLHYNNSNYLTQEVKTSNEQFNEYYHQNRFDYSNQFALRKRERDEEDIEETTLHSENNNKEIKENKDTNDSIKCKDTIKRKKKKNQKIKAQELLEDSLFLNLDNNKKKSYTSTYPYQINTITHPRRKFNIKCKKSTMTSTSSIISTNLPLDEDNSSSTSTMIVIHGDDYQPTSSSEEFMKYNFNFIKEEQYASDKVIISKPEQIADLEGTFFLSNNSIPKYSVNEVLPRLHWSIERYLNKNKSSLVKCLKEIEKKWKKHYIVDYREELGLYLIQYNNYSYIDTMEFLDDSKYFSEWLKIKYNNKELWFM